MSIKDGGPAFPEGNFEHKSSGMTLRDYFAAKALSGLCSTLEAGPEPNWDLIANDSYKVADAMLKAREEG